MAAYLMGLRDVTQLDIIPMRGALFENMAIVELIKARYNSGETPLLYFYRENSGKEVDIVEDMGLSLDLYEVKASTTFRPEYMHNMKYLEKLITDKVITDHLIYDGPAQPPTILNIRDL